MYHSNGLDKDPIEIDFTPPFRRIDMVEELNRIANLNINPKDLSSEEVNSYLKEACKKFDIQCSPPETTARLLDKVNQVFLFFIFFIIENQPSWFTGFGIEN